MIPEDRHYVYRHYNSNNELLYVGMSMNPIHRSAQHGCASHWFDDISRIEIEKFETKNEALACERDAIKKENPTFNRHLKRLDENGMTHAEYSRIELLNKIVNFKAVYSIAEVAKTFGFSKTRVKELVENGDIRSFVARTYKGPNGKMHEERKVTGWSLIDYIDDLDKWMKGEQADE